MSDKQLSLRLTDGAEAALEKLGARIPGYTRHALALFALEVGARALEQNPALLVELEQARLRARLGPLLASLQGAPAEPAPPKDSAPAAKAAPGEEVLPKRLTTPVASAPKASLAKAPKKCEQCGKSLEGKNERARFCGDTCKKRWHRAQGKA